MLTKCPECELQVSDKAFFCPHCGYPLKDQKYQRPYRSTKRKRLPNGFGQISEIKNKNLRKPYRAMVTVGKSETGRPIVKPLKPESYFETYNDAYAALVEYNRNPYTLENDVTLEEIYERWQKATAHVNRSYVTTQSYERAWGFMEKYYKMKVKDLRKYHVRECADSVSYSTAIFVKRLFSNLLAYAADNDVIDTNFAKGLTIKEGEESPYKEVKVPHITFTEEEMAVMWKNRDKKGTEALLLQCYTGMRPGELFDMKVKDVHLKERYMIGGSKTKAGKDRIIPIHSKMIPIVQKMLKEAKELDSEYLVNIMYTVGEREPRRIGEYKVNRHFGMLMKELGLNESHRPHDARVCFATRAKLSGMDEYAIKKIMGHTIDDLTERVYIKEPIEYLIAEMEKLK